LGVDHWAWYRAQSYFTPLADLEKCQPVERLPDRTAEAPADWLKGQPGLEVISCGICLHPRQHVVATPAHLKT
jgi:hypothetical protein